MKIKFSRVKISGYLSLAALCDLKGWMNGTKDSANIPPEYTIVTDGECWNVEKRETKKYIPDMWAANMIGKAA